LRARNFVQSVKEKTMTYRKRTFIDPDLRAAVKAIEICEQVLKRKDHPVRRNNALVAIADLRRFLNRPAFKR
jgi:hypothetical protein